MWPERESVETSEIKKQPTLLYTWSVWLPLLFIITTIIIKPLLRPQIYKYQMVATVVLWANEQMQFWFGFIIVLCKTHK